jgi:hypothetical protein
MQGVFGEGLGVSLLNGEACWGCGCNVAVGVGFGVSLRVPGQAHLQCGAGRRLVPGRRARVPRQVRGSGH